VSCCGLEPGAISLCALPVEEITAVLLALAALVVVMRVLWKEHKEAK
jgi:hypothetical protein